MAIVAAMSVMPSAELSTLPCPIADEATSSEPPIVLADGSEGSAAPGIEGGWLKPKRSAMLTKRCAPSLAPRGANTELQDTANALKKVPPHASPLAFCSV